MLLILTAMACCDGNRDASIWPCNILSRSVLLIDEICKTEIECWYGRLVDLLMPALKCQIFETLFFFLHINQVLIVHPVVWFLDLSYCVMTGQ